MITFKGPRYKRLQNINYCFQSVNVIAFSMAKGDFIKRLLLHNAFLLECIIQFLKTIIYIGKFDYVIITKILLEKHVLVTSKVNR